MKEPPPVRCLSPETVGGYWIIRVYSKEEAIRWALEFPLTDGTTIEIRQMQEFDDFPADVREVAAGFLEKQS